MRERDRLAATGLLVGLSVVLLAAACGSGGAPREPMPASVPGPADVVPASPSPSSSMTSPTPPSSSTFEASVTEIDGASRANMVSWHPGCPVPIAELRLLTVDYWGFDGRVHPGELIVHRDVAADVIAVFGKLFDARFPIQRMRLIDAYGGDDERSMEANNTSAFNCRPITGGTRWSEHSYGRAIDINPVQNPYVTGNGTVLPPEGRSFADRSRKAKGMIHPGDVVVEAFASVGWAWGGVWDEPQDYQHFSSTGR